MRLSGFNIAHEMPIGRHSAIRRLRDTEAENQRSVEDPSEPRCVLSLIPAHSTDSSF
jgi:hypothetical protein